jgi:hypothetical protein
MPRMDENPETAEELAAMLAEIIGRRILAEDRPQGVGVLGPLFEPKEQDCGNRPVSE